MNEERESNQVRAVATFHQISHFRLLWIFLTDIRVRAQHARLPAGRWGRGRQVGHRSRPLEVSTTFMLDPTGIIPCVNEALRNESND